MKEKLVKQLISRNTGRSQQQTDKIILETKYETGRIRGATRAILVQST